MANGALLLSVKVSSNVARSFWRLLMKQKLVILAFLLSPIQVLALSSDSILRAQAEVEKARRNYSIYQDTLANINGSIKDPSSLYIESTYKLSQLIQLKDNIARAEENLRLLSNENDEAEVIEAGDESPDKPRGSLSEGIFRLDGDVKDLQSVPTLISK